MTPMLSKMTPSVHSEKSLAGFQAGLESEVSNIFETQSISVRPNSGVCFFRPAAGVCLFRPAARGRRLRRRTPACRQRGDTGG